MNDFLLTFFLLLVIISLYSVLNQRKKSQSVSTKNASSDLSEQSLSSSTPLSRSSELSSKLNTPKSDFQPSQPSSLSTTSTTSTTSTNRFPNNHEFLARNIKEWGESNSSNYILPILNYLTHWDPSIRITVAKALGKLVSTKTIRTQTGQAIVGLGSLSRDPVVGVRLAAVEALSQVKSPSVIPYLKLAQKDPNSHVIKTASAALNYFKGYPSSSSKKVPHKPKNVVKQLSST
ncbi:MAG: HEAT repeat domain-containing protein [Crocosphaera sp.]|nr:HEAT repeat domain-containing protein [Crocosphaera sp.]